MEELDAKARPAGLCESLSDGRIKCLACGHACALGEGARGICRMRFNKGSILMAPYGYTAGMACDPVEKKPFFHVLPGAGAFSFGMLGCNFSCSFCQNYESSQTLKEPFCGSAVHEISSEQLVKLAQKCSSRIVVSTYNEPLITAEWSAEIFKKAKALGFLCGYVSNGYAGPRALEYIRPYADLYKVDLKCFDGAKYEKTAGGKLHIVLDSIRRIKELGFWLEIVTLVIPGFNDSEKELRGAAKFIFSVSPDIPWHVTAFHPDYKMTDPPQTPAATLLRAYEIGRDAGLRYVYPGNIPGAVLWPKPPPKRPMVHSIQISGRPRRRSEIK